MTLILGFLVRHWRIVGAAVLVGFIVLMIVRVDRLESVVREQRETIRIVKAERDSWERSYRASETIRAAEQADAVSAATEASSACDARIAEARRSARAIERIITKEPARDQNGCPRRELVDAGQLRDALRPAD